MEVTSNSGTSKTMHHIVCFFLLLGKRKLKNFEKF